MGIERLLITAYTKGNFGESTKVSEFEVMLNPEKYSRTYAINYNLAQGIGSASADHRYNNTKPETISLDLIFDSTGAIPSAKNKSVKDQLKEFHTLVVEYNGEIHRNNFLKLNWGIMDFQCVLSQYTVNYTMFKPSGEPLRAKVKATFKQYISTIESSAKSGNESPDLTHRRVVREGDTLPELCRQIYDDPSYYPEVAAFNKLAFFRKLIPGTEIFFPKIK